MYEDYRFVSREELHQLELGGLVGTNMVKTYMHGFFIDTHTAARNQSRSPLPRTNTESRRSSHTNTVVY